MLNTRAWCPILFSMALSFSLTGCETHTYLKEPGESRAPKLTERKVSEAGVVPVPVIASADLRSKGWAQHGRVLPVVDRIDGWSYDAHEVESAQLDLQVKTQWVPLKREGVSVVLFLLTAGIVPALETHQLTVTSELRAGDGTVLFKDQSQRRIRRNTTLFSPFALFMGGRERSAQSRAIHSVLSEQYGSLLEATAAQREAYDDLLAGPNDGEAKRAWLAQHRDNMFRPQVLQELLAMAPAGGEVAWHRDNVALLADYAALLEGEHALWAIGPAGRRPADVYARLAEGGSEERQAERVRMGGLAYPDIDAAGQQYLLDGGLPLAVVDAMVFSSESQRRERQQVAERRQQQEAHRQQEVRRAEIKTRVIAGNGGIFMSPYTRDGVTAEWVNHAINARMGSATGAAVGGAAGAYAANRALNNVPFGSMLGGMAGASAGRAVGRTVAVDRAMVQRTSDQSFATLDDMATYLVLHYGTQSNFSQVINAAEQVYPGLQKAVANAR